MSFVYIQLEEQTALFQTIQSSLSTAFCLHAAKCQNW